MIFTNKKLYTKTLLLTIGFIIIFSSSIIFYKLETYDSNRIYDLRKVDTTYRLKLFESYIDNVYEENSILIIGDSQPNGHKFPDKYIFSTLLEQELNINVINLAFQDSRILDNIQILKYCKQKNYKFKAIIFNINHSHIKKSEFQHLDLENKLDWKLGVLKDLKSFYQLAFNPNPKSVPSEKIKMAKYRNYFDMNNLTIASYQSKVAELVNITKKLTQNQIIYLTPHSTNALKYNNKNDINTINKYNQNILEYCKKNNIYCFEPNIKDDKYYIDIVHFNSLGHIEMSNQLKKILKTQIKNYDLEKTLSNK